MTALTNVQICKIILEQLGGSKFIAMTGAKDLHHGNDDDRTLYFALPRKFNGIKHVSITLEITDTYRMTFSDFRRGTRIIIHTVGNVYADQLQSIFTEQTGLATRL